MIQILPNWHPVFVHFTVALFSVSVLLFLVSVVLKQGSLKTQVVNVAYWNLWMGGLFTIVTLIMGWLAYNSVNHDTPSHAQMTTHKNWAFIAAALFGLLIVWSIVLKKKAIQPGLVFIVFALGSAGVLGVTAYHGGEAVYRFGLGVMSMPKVTGEGHAHKHPDGQGHGDTKKSEDKKTKSDGHAHSHGDEQQKPGPSHDSPKKTDSGNAESGNKTHSDTGHTH